MGIIKQKDENLAASTHQNLGIIFFGIFSNSLVNCFPITRIAFWWSKLLVASTKTDFKVGQ